MRPAETDGIQCKYQSAATREETKQIFNFSVKEISRRADPLPTATDKPYKL